MAAVAGVLGGLVGLGLIVHQLSTAGYGSTGTTVAAFLIVLAAVAGGAFSWLGRRGLGAALLLFAAFGMMWLFRFNWGAPNRLDYMIAAAFLLTAFGAVAAISAARPTWARSEVYRHSWLVRATHWINVLCIIILLMSGLQIFNAFPFLSWGHASDFQNPLVAIYSAPDAAGQPAGFVRIFGTDYNTTGVLGLSRGGQDQVAFPGWATIPSWRDLAIARLWHFAFAWLFVANGLIYVFYTLATRHRRDLVPTAGQWRGIGHTIVEHARLRFPHGREATVYNILQKLSYLAIGFVILPLMVLTGLSMSPGINAGFPWLVELFGGRQSARTFHFICASLVVLFVIVHVVMVILSGVWNNLRSMVTGRYAISEEPHERAQPPAA